MDELAKRISVLEDKIDTLERLLAQVTDQVSQLELKSLGVPEWQR